MLFPQHMSPPRGRSGGYFSASRSPAARLADEANRTVPSLSPTAEDQAKALSYNLIKYGFHHALVFVAPPALLKASRPISN